MRNLRLRKFLHAFGVHFWGPWMLATATYSPGPLLRKWRPAQWNEDVQIRACHICGTFKLKNL